jgi:transcriptional regulator with XRE-family HTH domain
MTRSERKLRTRIGRNLRNLRTLQALTLQKLADISGLHWRHIQKIEHGEVNITLRTVTRFADALKVDAGTFFYTSIEG